MCTRLVGAGRLARRLRTRELYHPGLRSLAGPTKVARSRGRGQTKGTHQEILDAGDGWMKDDKGLSIFIPQS